MSQHHEKISEYLAKVDYATLDDISNNCQISYYHNTKKHLGTVLSRMVSSGKVIRLKSGVFKFRSKRGSYPTKPRALKPYEAPENQTSLL